jgi:APA family basic amino acid/polyamine antiporter
VVLGVVAVVHLAGLHAAKRFQLLITGTVHPHRRLHHRGAPARTGRRAPHGARRRRVAQIVSTPFAVSLVYVSYAFTGWNAAGYIAGRSRPAALHPAGHRHGDAGGHVLYVLLNWAFLRTVPLDTLAGRVEVGALSANAMFGRTGTIVMSAIIATVLIATISAMVLGGSRVTYAVMADLPRWRVLGKRAANSVPRNAITSQVVLILVLL